MAQQSEWVAGATTYQRVSQDNVDYAVPNGKTVEDRDFIYIIKMDNKSGRNYFVQATTRQKSWELPDQSVGTGRSYRERVTLIYKTYNPEKVGSVDAALDRYKGQEEQLIADLVAKYGPEPQPAPSSESSSKPPPTPTQQGGGPEDERAAIRKRLVRFYNKYNPGKVATVDKALDAYAGQYEAMFAALVEKYGPEPEDSREETRARLVRFYEKYNPEKVASVDKALDAYAGQYETMFGALVTKYGPEPAEDSATTAGGGATSTPPSNVTEAPSSPPAAAAAPPAPAERSMEDRVRAMCKHYKPKKPDLADKYLAQYKGQEEELMKVLVQKYGPEPSANSTPPTSQNPSESGSFAGSVNASQSPAPATASPASEPSPAPTSSTTAAAPAESTPPASGSESPAAAPGGDSPAKAAPKERTMEDRVRAMCKHYKPKKPDLADKYLAQYKGQEADLLKTLTDKFGPEPPAEEEPASTTTTAPPEGSAAAPPATVVQDSTPAPKEGAAEASPQPAEKQGTGEQAAVSETAATQPATTTPEKKTESQPQQEQPKTASTFDFGDNRNQAPSLEQVQAAIGKSGSNQEQLLVTFIQDRDERLRQAHTRTEQYTATLDELRAQSATLQKQLNEVKAQSDLEVQGMKAHATKIQEETEFSKQSWELEREKLKAQADVAALVAEKTVQEEKVQFEKDRADFQKLQATLEEQLATLQYDILQREKQASKMLELLDTKDQDVRSLNDELAVLKAEAKHAPTHSVETQTEKENDESPEKLVAPQQTMREVEEQVSAIVNEVGGDKSPSSSPQQQSRSLNINTTDLSSTVNNLNGTASSLPGAFAAAPQGNLTSAEDEALFAEYENLMQGERNRRDELEDWKRKARLLEREVQRLRGQSVLQTNNQSQEENNKKLKVIVQLRGKVKKLEDKVADLEMNLLALPSEPTASSRSASGAPTTAELLSEKSSLESQVNLLQKELSETKNVARSQRKEIADLRGLLSIHRSSPAGGLRAALGASSPSIGTPNSSTKKKDANDNKQQSQKAKGTMGTAKRGL